ncbi:Protein FAR1-RELATED SEQUENCE [Abeliophyllum distichum]|uniref:Protein FAR1-RELATED SEQUENCE n=1 Tax=Abeliophyllum distichum TaxID=126358 RepID=A0ABD1RDD5_9LAMI
MSSSQRSDSDHLFLKKYVDRKNSLTDFVARFNRALAHQRHEELAANHIDLSQTPKVTTTLMIENQMVQIYTKKIFLLFQNELIQSNSYIYSKMLSSDEAKVAKGCEKRLKSGKDKALSQSNRQCSACGTSGHDRRTCPMLQTRLNNTNQQYHVPDPQYHALDSQYAYQAPDTQYAYQAPDSQYSYLAPNPQYTYHAPDPQYTYHAPDPQYLITGSNNASYLNP